MFLNYTLNFCYYLYYKQILSKKTIYFVKFDVPFWNTVLEKPVRNSKIIMKSNMLQEVLQFQIITNRRITKKRYWRSPPCF